MPPLEPVLSGEILIEAGQDTQDTPEIGQLAQVLCCFAALLEVPGQAPVAVRERAERGLDPPPDRQGREAAGGGVAERDLDLDGVPLGRRPDRRAGVDRVGLDPPQVPPGFGRPVEQGLQAVRVVQVRGRDARTRPNEQVRTWRLMPLTFLLPSTPRSPLCGPEVTLCESTIPVDGAGLLPRRARAAGVSTAAASAHTPSRRKRSQ